MENKNNGKAKIKTPSKSIEKRLKIKLKELKNSNALQRRLGGAMGPSCYMAATPQH